MSIQADLLNPELGYSDEGLSLTQASLYEAARRPYGVAEVLPPVAYRSKTFLELESEKIWTRSWVVVGLEQQIPSPGDLLPFTLGFHGLHVQRNPDGSLVARLNRHQHGGCRFVPIQCRTGHQTKCSITSCNYTRDADAMLATGDGVQTDEMFKFLGLSPEKLKPVRFGSWGPFLFANLDPECTQLEKQIEGLASHLPAWFQGPVGLRTRLWIDAKANWKEVGAAFVDQCVEHNHPHSDDELVFAEAELVSEDVDGWVKFIWAFPNLLLAVGCNYALAVVLQSTAPGKTLCRLFVLSADALRDDQASQIAYAWISRFRACVGSAEAAHQDHVLHGTESRPGTSAADLPLERSVGAHAINRFVSTKVCAEHKYYWTAPIMDAAMLMRGVR